MITDCYGLRHQNLEAFLKFYCIDAKTFTKWSHNYLNSNLKLPSTDAIIQKFANPDVMEARLNEFLRKRHGTENHGA